MVFLDVVEHVQGPVGLGAADEAVPALAAALRLQVLAGTQRVAIWKIIIS